DTLLGLGGNDTIYTFAGDDSVEGGDGDDWVNAQINASGGYGLFVSSGLQTIRGGLGNDLLAGGSDSDSIYGEDGFDVLFGGNGADLLDGGADDDTLQGDDGADTLLGGDGHDRLLTGAGDDSADGGAGDDDINAERSTDGGSPLTYASSGRQTLEGGLGHDLIAGGSDADRVSGGDGNDTLYGQEGDDTLLGGEGNDRLLTGAGHDSADGGAGDDDINAERPTAGSGLLIYPSGGQQSLEGGYGHDVVVGGNDADRVSGGDGNDTLYGQGGSDTLLGGAGEDLIVTDDGSQGDGAADSVDAGDGNDRINGVLTDASTGTYSFWDSSGAQTLRGGAGDDFIVGGRDGDVLDGGSGDDTLHGRDGDDTLIGGAGVDRLVGGAGDDTYVVSSVFSVIDDSAGGADRAEVHTSFVKIPSTVEIVEYLDGALPLPYWIDALLPDEAAGLAYRTALGASLTYGYTFPAAIPAYDDDPAHAEGYTAFTPAQQQRAVQALDLIASVTALHFVPVDDPDAPNTLAFARNAQTNSSGYAQYPHASATGSDVFIDVDLTDSWADGQYAAHVLIHEIGHALGLKHPFSVAEDLDEVAEPPYLYNEEDSSAWTRMSYTVDVADHTLGLAPFDIAALQYLYGIDASIRPADDTYVLDGATPGQFVWDGAGHDTLDASGLSVGATLHLTPGHWSHIGTAPAATITSPGQFTINFGTWIEDVIGSAQADRLYGNEAANAMDGGEGDDRVEGFDGDDALKGAGGADTLIGGSGDDWLDGGAEEDTATFSGVRAEYEIQIDPVTGALTVMDKVADRDGDDLLWDVEFLQFADERVAAPTASPGSVLEVRAYSWKTHTLLPGVVVGAANEEQVVSPPSGDDGRTALTGLDAGTFPLTVQHTPAPALADASSNAVNLQDAVAILKLIAGVPVQAGDRPLSPYQAIAADVDANGVVSLADALGVLRHAVGWPGAPSPAWVFLDESDPTVPALAAHPTTPGLPAAPQATLPAADTLGLVGVLRGDVDGSWTPPPGAQDLDEVSPGHFDALLTRLNDIPEGPTFSPTQWGIYPDAT
ncbi:MAG: matrixin family metalloprotease, partial [Rubrivivax sp.]